MSSVVDQIKQALIGMSAVVDPENPAYKILQALAKETDSIESDIYRHREEIQIKGIKFLFFKINATVIVDFWWELNTGRKGLKVIGIRF